MTKCHAIDFSEGRLATQNFFQSRFAQTGHSAGNGGFAASELQAAGRAPAASVVSAGCVRDCGPYCPIPGTPGVITGSVLVSVPGKIFKSTACIQHGRWK